MENASKALIIAGAILLSILLISLGIMIFTRAQEIVNGPGMDETQKTAFNAKFTKYEGTQKGAMVRSLVQDVLATNAVREDNNTAFITIAGSANVGNGYTEGRGAPDTSNIVSSRLYDISIGYDGGTGLVNQVTINNHT